VQLGLENKKKTMWAAVLGGLAILAVVFEFIPMLTESTTPASSAQAAAPTMPRVTAARPGAKGKKAKTQDLDPTLKLDLLASSEKTIYEGNGRNIFVATAEPPKIETPQGPGVTDGAKVDPGYQTPQVPPAPPIPLKFFGFASHPGEPKKVFLQQGEDVFVAGEGEIVNRRYKVVHIGPNAVEMQDMVYSGPPQNLPLTPG